MTRICALGNSHLAALMLGWKEIASEYSDVKISFFAARGSLMRDLTVRRRKLVPNGDKLRRYLKVNHPRSRIGNTFDGYLVVGLDFGWKAALEACSHYRAESHARDNRIPISDSCFAHTLRAVLRSTVAVETVGKLRQIAPAPICLVPVPLPAPGGRGSRALQKVEKMRDDGIVAAQLDRAFSDIAGELGVGFVGQPEFTKASPLRTNPEYTHGSLTFAAARPHADDDVQHMNEQYGRILVRIAVESLTGQGGSNRPAKRLAENEVLALD